MISLTALRELLRCIPDEGDLDGGLVLADALEELEYHGAARRLRGFLPHAAPIEARIRLKKLAEGPATQALWRPLISSWTQVKRLVTLALLLEEHRRAGRPLMWFNVEGGSYAPALERRFRRDTSYPVGLTRPLTRGAMTDVQFLIGPASTVHPRWVTPDRREHAKIIAVRRAALTTAPLYAIAPGGAVYRNVFR